MPENRRKRDSAKLVWDSKPKRAPNPQDIEFQTAELVIPNAATVGQFNLPIFNQTQAGVTSLFPGQFGELPLGGQDIDKSKMNRLIWGDNLLAMQALLAQGYAGKIDLIYIDPPFLSSADYNFQLSVEGKQIDKEASIIERLAYTDTWEGGLDSFLDMMYPRFQLMKRLLSNIGSIYVHIDSNTSHYMKVILDEVFGAKNFINEIVWKRADSHNDSGQGAKFYGRIHDCILVYSKSDTYAWNQLYTDLPQSTVEKWYRNIEEGTGRKYNKADLTARKGGGNTSYEWKGITPPSGRYWAYSYENMLKMEEEGRLIYSSTGKPYMKRYLDESKGIPLQDWWDDISMIRGINSKEKLDYPTQKPEALLERIIKASSNEGDLVADFFCGSGTTMAVADRLNRRWIGCNLDKVGLQVSRNRLV
jgi:adenine specific DNA methylase Mod